MAYSKTTWVDRAVATPNKYTKSGETATEVTLVQAPGAITNAGTPINAANMNKIEQGIFDAQAKADTIESDLGGLQFRDTNGYVEYYNGTEWLPVGDFTGRTPYVNNGTAAPTMGTLATSDLITINGSGLLTTIKVEAYNSGGNNHQVAVEIVLDGVVYPLYDSASSNMITELAYTGFVSNSPSAFRTMATMTTPLPFKTSAVIRVKNMSSTTAMSAAIPLVFHALALLD